MWWSRSGRCIRAVAVAALVAATLPAAADHGQSADGKTVTFHHKAGNEWWVELVLSGPDAADVQRAQAQDTGGAWQELTKRSWGAWAASFHIEPGHQVRFRAIWSDGAQVESCWFDHPGGDESCTGGWSEQSIRRIDGTLASGHLALGDADGDGQEDLLVPTDDGIHVHAWDSGWRHVDTIAPGRAFDRIAVGDADNDGQAEVYASSDFNDLYRFVWDGAWNASHSEVPSAGPWSISAIAVGDPDDDGADAVYLGTITDDAPLIEVKIVDGAFVETVIAEIVGGTVHLTVGDGDDDGDLELISGSQNRGNDQVRIIDRDGDAWSNDVIDGGRATDGTAGVAVGDVDRDGATEVYAARPSPQGVWMSRFDGAWSTTRIASLADWPKDMVLGDPDGDGADALYVLTRIDPASSEDGYTIHEVRWDGAWQAAPIAQPSAAWAQALALGEQGDMGVYVVDFPRPCCDRGDATIRHITSAAGPTPGVAFDPRNGNEWWVQVHVSGATPSRVQAQDTGDPWIDLALRDWGDWARSLHVEPGHDVRFRAMVDGTWHTSCWFTHPGGEPTGPCGDPPPGFEATFRTPGGNEWWVEVYVDADRPLDGVDARDDGGTWIALDHKSWGAWAKSFHVEPGSVIEFRARSGEGQAVSGGYVWPDGTPV